MNNIFRLRPIHCIVIFLAYAKLILTLRRGASVSLRNGETFGIGITKVKCLKKVVLKFFRDESIIC